MRPAAALGMMVKGVGGFVFGSGEHDGAEDDGGVEQLLETISNGTLAVDRRAAMEELRVLVEESRQAQLAFGTMGFPVLLAVLREEREDLDLVRGALETLVTAVNPEGAAQDERGQLSPSIVNCELLAREHNIVALFLSFLEEEDFYVRYYVLQLLTRLLSVSPSKLQEEVLATPQGITKLMDMMMEREVIRNEALLLLAQLTRAAKEIQKIVVFEGAFDRVFNIIREEGGSDGGIVVLDCLELLNNLLRSNPSNQVFLRETIGLQHVASFLKLRKGSGDGSQQKSMNLLCGLETVALLLAGGENMEAEKNQTSLAQSNLLDSLLTLCVEGRISAVAIRCLALKCIGDLVNCHPRNRDILSSKLVGDENESEPALVSILRVLLRTNNLNECIAAEYVIKCFCEDNLDGQVMLASTIAPLPQSTGKFENDRNMSFGSMLVQALIGMDGKNDLEASCRAASVLSHILKNNVTCKERVLKIPLEDSTSRALTPELLLPRCMRYLTAASSASIGRLGEKDSITIAWLQPVLLRLLVTWLAECPQAVSAFLDNPTHLLFLVGLISSSGASSTGVHVAGLASVLLGECIVYNDSKRSGSSGKDAISVLDILNHRIGVTTFLSKWEEMRESPLFIAASSPSRLPIPLTRATAAAVAAGDGFIAAESSESRRQAGDDSASPEPAVTLFYDAPFVQSINALEPVVRKRIMELYSNGDREAVEVPGCERLEGEKDSEYVARLKNLIQNQAQKEQESSARISSLTQALLLKEGGSSSSAILDDSTHKSMGILQSENDGLKRQLRAVEQRFQAMERQLRELQERASEAAQLAGKYEGELQSLSAAYNNLERVNQVLEARCGGAGMSEEALEAAREEGRLEAQRENEAELNDLLVCLGQEESKCERMRSRLEELGEDVDVLLAGIGDNEEGGGDED